MKKNNNLENSMENFYSNYTGNNNQNKKSKEVKKRGGKGKKIISMILIVTLCFTLGASASIFSVGYLLNINDVNFKELLNNSDTQETELSNIVDEKPKTEVVTVLSEARSPISSIAQKVIPSVVGIKVSFPIADNKFYFNSNGVGGGEGSGIVYSSDGYILTNNHVIEGALMGASNRLKDGAKIEVYIEGKKDSYEATIVGRSENLDIALIKIEATNLIAADMGDSDLIQVGETAIAIGNPGGISYMNSVTAGIISGVDRELYEINEQNSDAQRMHLIQTDAAINPGNSGGPLVNINGQVIGINTVKIADIEFEGLGFAIPINNILELVGDLMEKGYIGTGTPNIGISIETAFDKAYADSHNLPVGALVIQVGAFSPADLAGIEVYDIITEFNGVSIKSYEQLITEKEKYKPNDIITVKVYRNSNDTGEYIELVLTLGETRK